MIRAIIFGAGGTGRELYKRLKKDTGIEVVAFADNFKRGMYEGVPIIATEEITDMEYDCIYIATVAMDAYVHSIIHFIGSYIAVLGGVDAIVFTAGIGENGSLLRKLVIERLAYLGITLDEEANQKRGSTTEISTPDSKVRVFVIPTDEEYMIAKDTMKIVFG